MIGDATCWHVRRQWIPDQQFCSGIASRENPCSFPTEFFPYIQEAITNPRSCFL